MRQHRFRVLFQEVSGFITLIFPGSGYILKALEGEGPLTAEDLKSRMDYLKKKCAEISDQITEQERLLAQAESKDAQASAQLERLRGYAKVFENAAPAERRMIASALIERITVYPGYELDIQFRIGVDTLARLPEEDVAEESYFL